MYYVLKNEFSTTIAFDCICLYVSFFIPTKSFFADPESLQSGGRRRRAQLLRELVHKVRLTYFPALLDGRTAGIHSAPLSQRGWVHTATRCQEPAFGKEGGG